MEYVPMATSAVSAKGNWRLRAPTILRSEFQIVKLSDGKLAVDETEARSSSKIRDLCQTSFGSTLKSLNRTRALKRSRLPLIQT